MKRILFHNLKTKFGFRYANMQKYFYRNYIDFIKTHARTVLQKT